MVEKEGGGKKEREPLTRAFLYRLENQGRQADQTSVGGTS